MVGISRNCYLDVVFVYVCCLVTTQLMMSHAAHAGNSGELSVDNSQGNLQPTVQYLGCRDAPLLSHIQDYTISS